MHTRDPSTPGAFERYAADRLDDERDRVAREWLDRLEQRMSVRPRRVLPTHELLDHVPRVLRAAAACIRAGEPGRITDDPRVLEELAQVARLRRRQGYDVQEVVAEFEVLSRVLLQAGLDWIDAYRGDVQLREAAAVIAELARVPLHMGEVTVGIFREQEAESHHRDVRHVREFLHDLAHQVKTPLGAAEGAAELLAQSDADPAERHRLVALIGRSLARVRAAVTDVLALADAAAGRGEETPVPLDQVVEDARREVAPAAEAAGVHLRVDPAPAVQVDGPRVELILLNLLSNAVKYADPGKADRWVHVEFTSAEPDGGWNVRVRDNGLGIPRELHARVFDRFFRARPGHGEGTGLGLSIARDAARQLGTLLELDSEPGVGTTVRFVVPASAGSGEPGHA